MKNQWRSPLVSCEDLQIVKVLYNKDELTEEALRIIMDFIHRVCCTARVSSAGHQPLLQ